MEFVNIAEFRQNASAVFDRLEQVGEVVVLRNGRPIGLLAAVDSPSLDAFRVAFHRTRAQLAAERLRASAIAPRQITEAIRKTRQEPQTRERARVPRR
jgi:antitoxin (DNA-binding transcriptional repressor) of toxin-antitoxin stability system